MRIALAVFSAMVLGIYLYSLWQRPVTMDDAWIGEHAYWLAQEGAARSELMHGAPWQAQRVLTHHKLFTLQGALAILIFGLSPWALKSISLLYLGAFFWIWKKHLHSRWNLSGSHFLFLSVLFLWHGLVFNHSFNFRPEMALLFWGYLSFWALEQYHRSSQWKWAAAAGGLAAVAALHHLNGCALALAGGSWLLIQWIGALRSGERHWLVFRDGLLFSLGFLLLGTIYFFDFSPEYGWEVWRTQRGFFHYARADWHPLYRLLFNLVRIQEHFLHSPREQGLSLLLIVGLFWKGRSLYQKAPFWVSYTLLLVLCQAAISPYKSTKYMLLYLPHLAGMSYLCWMWIWNTGKTWQRAVGAVLLLFYLVGGGLYNLPLTGSNYSAAQLSRIIHRELPADTRNLKVIGPLTLFFEEVPKFDRYQCPMPYEQILARKGLDFEALHFFNAADSMAVDYIILGDWSQKKLRIDTSQHFSHYDWKLRDGPLWILQHSSAQPGTPQHSE